MQNADRQSPSYPKAALTCQPPISSSRKRTCSDFARGLQTPKWAQWGERARRVWLLAQSEEAEDKRMIISMIVDVNAKTCTDYWQHCSTAVGYLSHGRPHDRTCGHYDCCHTCMHTYMHTCNTRIHAHTVHAATRTRACKHAYGYIHVHTYTRPRIHMYVCKRAWR